MPKTLLEQIEDIEFSADATALFVQLMKFSASDEEGAVIIVAAATLLARELPDLDPVSQNRLTALTREFGEVVFAVRDRLPSEAPPARGLRLVGGIDA